MNRQKLGSPGTRSAVSLALLQSASSVPGCEAGMVFAMFQSGGGSAGGQDVRRPGASGWRYTGGNTQFKLFFSLSLNIILIST